MNPGLLMGFGATAQQPSRAPDRWSASRFYKADEDAWSPVSGHAYRRLVAGSGGVDPSTPSASWKLIGPGGIRSIQRGSRTINAGTLSSGVISITPVLATANATLRIVSVLENGAAGTLSNQVTITFSGLTAIQLDRFATTNQVDVGWEVVEYWA